MSLIDLTAVQLGERIKKKEVSVIEALNASLEQIKRVEQSLHSYVTVDETGARARAERLQKKIDEGEMTGALAGVPLAVKDNLCTRGLRTTCSSRMLEDFVPPYSAQAVLNLEENGALILGKTNMDEFAMGSTTETSYFGVTRNPWNTEHVPGGSSGGSAAAVAARECFGALGTDTGGSIRQPASFCGVVGIKPTYGTVSRYGMIAYASSMDQIGTIGRDVTDSVYLLDSIASYDRKDATSRNRGKERYADALAGDVKGLRIGIPEDFLGKGLDEEVRAAILDAVKVLEQQGAVVKRIKLGLVDYLIPAYYVIASAEASSNLARFDGIKYGYRAEDYTDLHSLYKKSRSEGFGLEVKRRIMLGSFVLSSGYYDAYYLKALRTKKLIREAFDKAFAECDVILQPTSPVTAPRIGESLTDPLRMYLMDICTIAANLAGLPGMSVPFGTDKEGLPIGVQFLADCFEENKMIRAGHVLEQMIKTKRMPEIKGGEQGE